MYTVQQQQQHVVQQNNNNNIKKCEKETIHSGHFMVSHFEAEEQDDEDNVAIPLPEITDTKTCLATTTKHFTTKIDFMDSIIPNNTRSPRTIQQQLEIDTSLSKLFQCMTLAYRQKLTSPKWNRFRGIRLRWKDKIRLNNVIWRCWHLQFIKKENTLICQFASPLDVDTHNKPEAVVLEGKYWKRKLAAVTAEYKKWRLFYKHNTLGHSVKDSVEMLDDMNLLVWDTNSSDDMRMMVDEDYMGLMSDTLFSTITNQPFAFPDSREIAKSGLAADFIQPSLGPLQPNLDDYMDTFDPLQDFITNKLPTVPEEQNQQENMFKNDWNFLDSSQQQPQQQTATTTADLVVSQQQYNQQYQPQQPIENDTRQQQQQIMQANYPNIIIQEQPQYVTLSSPPPPPPPPSYHSAVINAKNIKAKQQQQHMRGGKLNQIHQMQTVYQNYTQQQQPQIVLTPQQSPQQQQQFKIPQQQPTIVPSPHGSPQQQQPPQKPYKYQIGNNNMKYPSQQVHIQQQQQQPHTLITSQQQIPYSSSTSLMVTVKDEKPSSRRGGHRGRQRSRSNTRETTTKRPPLLSAISNPELLPPPPPASTLPQQQPSSSTTSVLLTQLLTNSTDTAPMYNRSQNMVVTTTGTTTILTDHHHQQQQIQIKEENSPIPILPQPLQTTPQTTIIIPTQMNTVSVPSNSDTLLLNSFSSSNSPILDTSSQNINSPTSSQGSIGSPSCCDSLTTHTQQRDRRVGHIHAEQKRRYNIKNGFDMIHSLIPHLNQNPNAKLSKAAMLQKGAEYIRQLHSERNQLKEEMDSLRQQIQTLNNSISNCQSMLPATGAPVSRHRDSKMQEMFDDYVRNRTLENWKFWIFSLIIRPLLNSFNNFVSTASLDDLYSTTMVWIEQRCTLGDLRPVVLSSFRYLSTKTDILSDPDKLPDEARQMVLQTNNQNK